MSVSAAAAASCSQHIGLRLVMNYDILCPSSWVLYQVLQGKLESWRKAHGAESVHIDYAPMCYPLICQDTYGAKPASMLLIKKHYVTNELYEICEFYGVEKADFDMKPEHLLRRNFATLLFLNNLRRKRVEFYEPFLRETWHQFWHLQKSVGLTVDLHRIGRVLRAPFSVMDDLLMRTEEDENRRDLSSRHTKLLTDERITGSPWLQVYPGGRDEKLFAFSDILRVELLDELILSGALFDDSQRFESVVNKDVVQTEEDRKDGFMDFTITDTQQETLNDSQEDFDHKPDLINS